MTSEPVERPDQPQWLNEHEQATWLALGALVIRLPSALEADLQGTTGLSLFDYLVLSGLSEAPERTLRMSELAARVNSSLSRLSHVVSRLEKRGWVTRSPWPHDGRHTIASLTPAGYSKVEMSAPEHVASVRRLVIDALTPIQLRHLDDATNAILARITATTATAAGGQFPTSACVKVEGPPPCSG
jgi:DNA-binding MarR family transcriptional regulator